MDKDQLPRCIKTGCKGKLKKHNGAIHSKLYQCMKCGRMYELQKKIGSGFNFL